MKKRIRKNKEHEHRGNDTDLFRQYQERMNLVRKAHRSFYTREGKMKYTGSQSDLNK